MNNVLVTGGLGFIASHLSRLLVNYGYNVIIIDKGTYSSDIRRIEDIKDEVKLYMGDICDEELIEIIIKKDNIHTIVNTAAESHVDNSINDSKPFIRSNVEGVQNLLDIIRRKDIRFIQLSTDEVYGSINKGSFDENDRLRPGNPYSACKAGADLLCLAYKNTFDLDVIITRSSNNYGQFQHTEKYIPRMIDLAINKKPLEVYGNGTNIRDWLYVTDNCEAIKLVMEKGRKGEIYNIGANNEMTNNQIAKIIADRFKVPIKYIQDRLGHDFRYSIDCTKIKEELGWKPVTKFEDGIEKTIDFYEELIL